MRKSIKFFCHYDIDENMEYRRNYALSAKSKIDHLIRTINSFGFTVELCSLSFSTRSKSIPGSIFIDNFGNKFKWQYSYKRKGTISKIIRMLLGYILISIELLRIKKSEQILFYHSIQFSKVVYLFSKIKKFTVILELEEVYADADNKINKKNELKLINYANGYILSNDSMINLLSSQKKPIVVYYGPYTIYKRYNLETHNSKIRIVYAGTFNSLKAGVNSAIDSAMYLDDKYELNILGFGTKLEIENVKSRISEVSKLTKCKINYIGKLVGEEYLDYISKCNIGLSTQNSKLLFNSSSFPSKILVYLCCGLNVVSTNVEVVKESTLSDLVSLCQDDSPYSIADTIINIKLIDKQTIESSLLKHQEKFTNEIEKLIRTVKNEK